MKRARVTAAYATAKVLDPATGKPTVYGYYAGGVLPDGADPEDVARLVRRGYAEWLDEAEALAEPEPESEPESKAKGARKTGSSPSSEG